MQCTRKAEPAKVVWNKKPGPGPGALAVAAGRGVELVGKKAQISFQDDVGGFADMGALYGNRTVGVAPEDGLH